MEPEPAAPRQPAAVAQTTPLTTAICPGLSVARLLRNTDWPDSALADIFTGSLPTCPPPIDPGCPPVTGSVRVTLDPYGPDCDPATPGDSDLHVSAFVCGSEDPDDTVLSDTSKRLVFYQVDNDPPACNSLRLAKQGGRIGIYCSPICSECLPAFPGAEGFGAHTAGGRLGRVIAVTNTNDSGPGSLREAIEASGPRIVVFRVGGTIVLLEDLRILNPFITIAGQTAPGDGIALRGGPLTVRTHDVIIRGLRIRVGADECPTCTDPEKRDGFRLSQAPGSEVFNVVIDHVSVSWALDEGASTWINDVLGTRPVHQVTVQWSLIAESLHCSVHPDGCHSMGFLVGDHTQNITLHHNLLAHNNDRNPLIQADSVSDLVNNVVYNWGIRATQFHDPQALGLPACANVIGNAFRPGPDTRRCTDDPSAYRRGITIRSSLSTDSKFYLEGNIGPNRPTDTGDQWAVASGDGNACVPVPADYRWPEPVVTRTVTPHSPSEAIDLVLAGAGAVTPRDQLDQLIVESVINETGHIIDSVDQSLVGGWPVYAPGTPPADSDQDGMPDTWEVQAGLSPDDPADASQVAPSGYTWIEEYINSLLP
jgi:pectate lyase